MARTKRNEFAAMTDDDLRDRIAERAYFRAEQRGFSPGYELEDWTEAEKEIRAEIRTEEPESIAASDESPD